MKKSLLLVCVLLSMRSFAQEKGPFTLGPIVSMTSTSLNADPDFEDQIAGSGYNIGAFARVKLLFLYAQADISFGSKSASVIVNSQGSNTNVTFKLSGADASAIIGMRLFGLGEKGNLRIFAGYNYNNYTDITYSVDGSTLSADNVNSSNNSMLGGIGIDISRLTIDAKYISGLSDIASSGNQEVKTSVINLTVGFKIL